MYVLMQNTICTRIVFVWNSFVLLLIIAIYNVYTVLGAGNGLSVRPITSSLPYYAPPPVTQLSQHPSYSHPPAPTPPVSLPRSTAAAHTRTTTGLPINSDSDDDNIMLSWRETHHKSRAMLGTKSYASFLEFLRRNFSYSSECNNNDRCVIN